NQRNTSSATSLAEADPSSLPAMRSVWEREVGMEPLRRIELFGGLRAIHTDRIVDHFRTQKTAALLAYLTYYAGQPHQRQSLIKRYWPKAEFDPAAGGANLRQALTSLRRQFEAPGVPSRAVIVADRKSVQLDPEAVSIDVAEFMA